MTTFRVNAIDWGSRTVSVTFYPGRDAYDCNIANVPDEELRVPAKLLDYLRAYAEQYYSETTLDKSAFMEAIEGEHS